MAEPLEVLYEQQARGQEKYIYFLLAMAGAAIAFAIQRTGDSQLAWSQTPLALAVAFWAMSFWFGIQRLDYMDVFRSANMEHLKHRQVNQRREQMEHTMLDANERVIWYGRAQLNSIVAGALCFVAWHVIEMGLRTHATVPPAAV
jgi:hypothetical protein